MADEGEFYFSSSLHLFPTFVYFSVFLFWKAKTQISRNIEEWSKETVVEFLTGVCELPKDVADKLRGVVPVAFLKVTKEDLKELGLTYIQSLNLVAVRDNFFGMSISPLAYLACYLPSKHCICFFRPLSFLLDVVCILLT